MQCTSIFVRITERLLPYSRRPMICPKGQRICPSYWVTQIVCQSLLPKQQALKHAHVTIVPPGYAV